MARKPNFTKKKKRQVHGATFWDQEYTRPTHLKLSEKPSEDLAKCTRFLLRQKRSDVVAAGSTALDVGCGNGRNLIYLSQTFRMRGVGIDISSAAIAQAKRASVGSPITYHVGSAATPLPLPNESVTFALDMMTSHFLSKSERTALRDEIYRVLTPGGFLFMKTFLKDEDGHTSRLLQEFPGLEVGSYIHPIMGIPEYVYSEDELRSFLSERFIIRDIKRSHRHRSKDGNGKRRTISMYVEKDFHAS